ncbi:HAD-IIB family hydrolase [Spiroplasma culicicola]|uniref:HAD superfamily hydrolase n=1 Tax=Spiroplasma culicicola AES-1 TaxID=1276246 RepID=W6A5W7_9MOLU|nr:HAD-IIB family hydrolase [Spiroplasma culicicola]AHI52382.1 hypothetical protein SCULI_v1c00410 [Spiroplasma culicicola AES-1]
MKWWFSDYDGTIQLHNEPKIKNEDMDFINKWIGADNKLIITTGRNKFEALEKIQEYKLDYEYLITNNGAMVHDKNNKTLMHSTISLDIRKKLVEKLDIMVGRCGIAFTSNNDKKILCGFDKPKKNETEPVLEYWFNQENVYEQYRNQLLTDKNVNNIAFYCYIEDINFIKELFKDIKSIKILQTFTFVVEIMDEHVSKKAGIEFIQKIHNFNDSDIYTSGDGENDIEMLEGYQNSFAINSGLEIVKQKANYIIDSVKDIEKYL